MTIDLLQQAADRIVAKLDSAQRAVDPNEWIADRLKEYLWSGQRRIATSIVEHRSTAVPAAHGLGKSRSAADYALWWLNTKTDPFVITCYVEGTEVLTRGGWKLFDDVSTGPTGDEFATRSQLGEFQWQHASKYYEADWDGEVVDFDSRGPVLSVTPNHRMLLQWSGPNGQRGEHIKAAGDVPAGRHNAIPLLSHWRGQSPEKVEFGDYTWLTEDFAAFLGAWLAEGSLGGGRRDIEPFRAPERECPECGRRFARGMGMHRNQAHGIAAAKDSKRYYLAGAGRVVITQMPKTKGFEPYRQLLARMLGVDPIHRQGKNFHFNCRPLWEFLRTLGTASTKHIPDFVKDWAPEHLATLIHYYLLGDGHQMDGHWRATTVSNQLADDIQEIAQKAGMCATITVRAPRDAMIAGRRIAAENCRPSYEIRFIKARTRHVQPSRRHYVGKVRCVSVPNEILYVRYGKNKVPLWCGNTAPTAAQVSAILWREIKAQHAAHKLPGRVTMAGYPQLQMAGALVGVGRKPSDYDESTFQGIHALNVLILFDEAAGIPAGLWEQADSLMTNSNARMLAIGNPTDPSSQFARVCAPGSGWNVIRLDGLRSPLLTEAAVAPYPLLSSLMKTEGVPYSTETVPERLQQLLTGPEWINERITRWGVGSSIWQARVRGIFPVEADADAVIPLAWVVAAQDRYEAWAVHKLSPPGRQVHGLDVGRSADQDETVLATRHGHVVYDLETWRVKDLEETTGRVAGKLRAMPTSTVVVDETGIGAGVLDALRGQGLSAVGFVASGKNTGTDRNGEFTFLNNRAAAWWRLREALDPAHHPDLCLPLDDMLAADLTAPRWKLVRQGVIQIESKDDIRKRLGRSTDRGDAVVQSVWQSTLVGPDPDVAKWGDNAPTDQQASDAEIIADWLEDYA